MAAGKWKLYDTAKLKIAQGIIDLDGHSFKMALFKSTSNCDTLTHDEFTDLSNEATSGTGYTAGGAVITNNTLTNTSGTIKFDCDDVTWIGAITARFAVIYDDTVTGDPLLAVCLLDTAPADVTSPSGYTFRVSISSSGVFTLSGATSN